MHHSKQVARMKLSCILGLTALFPVSELASPRATDA